MALVRTVAAAVEGVDGYLVPVEVSRAPSPFGPGRTSVVGLPDAAVREAIDRVGTALRHSGLTHGGVDTVVVNLAPADRRKEGTGFDLAIALGLCASFDDAGLALPADTLFLAELGLDGALRPVRGCLAAAVAARQAGLARMVVAPGNAGEAAVVAGLTVHAPADLATLVGWLAKGLASAPVAAAEPVEDAWTGPDLADVKGQDHAKRALAIAAAGGHNLLMLGPPGSGKTMLARRLPGILPPMTEAEALEVTRVQSVSGLLARPGLARERPFRAPHHNVSQVGLVGGGPVPRPGEVSLAHLGVLFLDELPEYGRTQLESLRQPLEDGHLTISRSAGRIRLPSRCMLVAAMNPCPCGYLGHPTRRCTDSADAVHRYRSRISGPLLDRIDLHIEVPAQPPERLLGEAPGEDSATVRARVVAARDRMLARQGRPNAMLDPRGVRSHLHPAPGALDLLGQAIGELGLSARAADRIAKVARTLADLDGATAVSTDHIAEAVGYRVLDRPTG
jgi:magnesium chelatase family protein